MQRNKQSAFAGMTVVTLSAFFAMAAQAQDPDAPQPVFTAEQQELGQAAYFGLAAYIAALMYLHVTQSFWLVALTVCGCVAVFSLLLGAVAIRAKGVYFALITFGAAEILSKIAHNTRAIGGSDGLIGIPIPAIPLLPGIGPGTARRLGTQQARGEIVAVNDALNTRPTGVNANPHGSWIIQVKPHHDADAPPDALLDAGVRNPVAEGPGGYRLLVWPADLARARDLLRQVRKLN